MPVRLTNEVEVPRLVSLYVPPDYYFSFIFSWLIDFATETDAEVHEAFWVHHELDAFILFKVSALNFTQGIHVGELANADGLSVADLHFWGEH